MNAPALDLNRPRDLGAILNTTFSLYGKNFPLFGAVAVLVVVPVDLVFYGILMGRLGGYDATPPLGDQFAATYGSLFIALPLITAMHVSAVVDLGEGRRPALKDTMRKGFDVFGPLLLTLVLIWLITLLGFVALIIPGIYLYVALLVAPQAVVVENKRGMAAVRRSMELVKDNWWRVFGISIVVGIIAGIAAAILYIPGELIAAATDSGPIALMGQIIGDSITYSVQALTATLIYFDLKARKEGWYAQGPPGYQQPPPQPGGWQPPPPTGQGPQPGPVPGSEPAPGELQPPPPGWRPPSGPEAPPRAPEAPPPRE